MMDPIKFRLRIFLILMGGVMVLGILGFMLLEGISFVDAVYFSIVTVTTVGYGDISPVTPVGKIFSVVLIVTGVGVFMGVVANATEMMLNRREKEARLEKQNMMIGIFFHQMGTRLLTMFTELDPDASRIREWLHISDKWTAEEFGNVADHLKSYDYPVMFDDAQLEALDAFLEKKSRLMLRLMENPNLMEHERFTDLLMAVFHLADELQNRQEFSGLPDKDLAHLTGDMKRAYKRLVLQWIEYMEHLKKNYPYLFSLSMRTNPFDSNASVIVQ